MLTFPIYVICYKLDSFFVYIITVYYMNECYIMLLLAYNSNVLLYLLLLLPLLLLLLLYVLHNHIGLQFIFSYACPVQVGKKEQTEIHKYTISQ